MWPGRDSSIELRLDGILNSSDFVTVFIAGEYEDDVPGYTTFEEGDWNGDGDFDSSDFVAAFRAGTYVAVARPQIHSIWPDAVDWFFADHDEDKNRSSALVA